MSRILIFIPELIVAWYFNGGNEYKWWSPAIAIYISSCLVSIWVIEMDLYIIKWYKMAVYPNSTSFDPDADGNFFAAEPMGKVADVKFKFIFFFYLKIYFDFLSMNQICNLDLSNGPEFWNSCLQLRLCLPNGCHQRV